MAGNKSHYVTPRIFNVASGAVVNVKNLGPLDQYLTNIARSPDEKKIYIAIVNREQNHMWLNEYDATTGDFVKNAFWGKRRPLHWAAKSHAVCKNNPTQFIGKAAAMVSNHFYLYGTWRQADKTAYKRQLGSKSRKWFWWKGEHLFYRQRAKPGKSGYTR